MPLPMVHLAVAVRLAAARKSADSPEFADMAEFYLGCIAPDAIHARAGAGRDDKRDSHYAQGHPARCDLGALAKMLTGGWASGKRVSFAEGYAAHVLTDHLWQDTVAAAFRERMQREGLEADLRVLYYQDCDKLDLDLYDTAPWRPAVWGHLASATVPDFPPLLTASEIASWRDHVLGWFDKNPDKRLHDAARISQSEIDAFIDYAAGEVANRMREWRSSSVPHAATCGPSLAT